MHITTGITLNPSKDRKEAVGRNMKWNGKLSEPPPAPLREDIQKVATRSEFNAAGVLRFVLQSENASYESITQACGIQQSAYPSSPGKWHMRLALENSRTNTGTTGIFFRVKAESHYQGFTQPPTYW